MPSQKLRPVQKSAPGLLKGLFNKLGDMFCLRNFITQSYLEVGYAIIHYQKHLKEQSIGSH